ncbi:SDR family NAD(P)-dependent oxidoreductase [Gemmatimonadota bacterium Y43]|uniref:SDR family NAD(P)-dependent oxidoreductase n=1 Tax=Gaopeijia maritima TaxID=3119007 RepID=UPI00328B9F0D
MSDGTGQMTPLKRAYLALERLQAEVASLRARRHAPIAVVGIGCRLPGGVADRHSFETLLLEGRDAVSDRPAHPRRGWPDTAAGGAFPHPPAGWLDLDPAGFDPAFFGISPREAAGIDPQQRLLLEVAWEAIEDAGIDPRGLAGTRTGVFVGMAGDDYAQLQFRSSRLDALLDSHFASGVGQSMASGRLAYLLGLEGPAITVDTACSSSLVAVHLACGSLRSGESDVVLAGGVNLILSDAFSRAFGRSRMLADDGRCRAFAEGAAGFGRGEGCGVVVLKRLADAVEAGDPVLGVIRGSATNQDGASTGLTAPSGRAQVAVIRAALEAAGVGPDDIDAIEAHGTGTELGDPIELRALGEAFAERTAERPLLLGSVKTNMGHLEAAAGITGLIKGVLALRAGTLPPHLHFERPTSHVDWGALPLEVAGTAAPLPEVDRPHRLGVSSFGFSGTNVHVVLEAPAPAAVASPRRSSALVLPLSAASSASLHALAERWIETLPDLDDATLRDACHTAALGRAALDHRVTVVGSDAAELREGLQAFRSDRRRDGVQAGRARADGPPALGWFFTGQGSQYPGMLEGLADESREVAEVLDRLDAHLRDDLEVPLRQLLAADGRHAELLHRTDHTQPALFAVEAALAAFWRGRGVEPDLVLGHSIGEFAAAWVAGVFDLETGASIVAARGRRMQAVAETGRMIAVMAPESAVAERVRPGDPDVAIAAVNAPAQTVVSGRTAAVDEVERWAAERGYGTRSLRTSHAFHSPLMESAARAFAEDLSGVELHPASKVRFVSTVTGSAIEPEALARPDYWVEQIRAPVRFHAAAAEAARRVDLALEVGPHPALAALVGQSELGLAVLPTLRRDHAPWPTALTALGAAFAHGLSPRWPDQGRRGAAPLTPFERMPLWVDLGEDVPAPGPEHPLLGHRRESGDGATWEIVLDRQAPAFIDEHRVGGRALLPGAAFFEMMYAAAAAGGEAVELRDLGLRAALDLTDGPRRVRTRLGPESEAARVEVLSRPVTATGDDGWTLHAVATVGGPTESNGSGSDDADRLEPEDPEAWRGRMRAAGYDFGPRLGGLCALEVGAEGTRARVRLPEAAREDGGAYRLHPLVLDAALQAVGPALGAGGLERRLLPVAVDRLRVVGATDFLEAEVRTRIVSRSRGGVVAEVVLDGAEGRIELGGVLFRPVASQAVERLLHRVEWVDDPAPGAAATADPAIAHQIDDAIVRALKASALDADVRGYDAFIDRLEARSAGYVGRALKRCGFAPPAGAVLDLEAVAGSLKVPPSQHRLLARCLDIMAERGALGRVDGGWTVPDLGWTPPAPPEPSRGETGPEARLLDRCGPHLDEVLQQSGVDPLELLFPGGDTSLAGEMYHEAPLARVFNGTVAATVARAAAASPADRPFRVLEVGGGTGGTTRPVMEALAEFRDGRDVEVVFTDVSPLFVSRAVERFGDAAGFEGRLFDLDEGPAGEGWDRPFDVIVAANCLHAARDLPGALSRLRGLLRSGGLLLAPEVFAPHAWFDLTVGLTEGWWHFDDDVRTDYPCVDAPTWIETLRSAGFRPLRVEPLAGVVPGLWGTASGGQGLVVATAGVPDRSWVVLADRGGLAERVARRWSDAGRPVHLIDPDAGAAALEAALHGRGRIDLASFRALDWEGTRDAVDGVVELVELVRAAAARPAEAGAVGGVHLVTRGACVADPGDVALNPAAAAAWGVMRTAALELPELRWCSLDLDPGAGRSEIEAEAAAVAGWLADPGPEPQRAIRRGAGRVPRWLRGTSAPVEPRGDYRLAPPASGGIEGLAFHEGERREPGSGEVEIRVIASALNFKDVLNVAGLYPGDPGPLGSECAGVVTRVGPGVDLEPGARVVAASGHAYGRHVVADATLVARLPDRLGFADGAAIPIAYLTAWLGLVELADLQPGDRVLIHAAAGGVGSAARAIARRAGAEIIATAGTPEKRDLLRREGIEHVFDSRSDAFVDGVFDATDGRGVTVVLNSLADDLVDASFRCIAQGGRFIELGKRGVWTPERVAGLDRDIAYHLVDWGVTHRHEPVRIGASFARVVAAVGAGELPPLPVRRFPLHEVREAFRVMARGGHVGKLVLEHPVHDAGEPIRFRPDGVYLLTGGTGGLGLRTARWAASEGAGTLVLVGRSAPGPDTEAEIDALREGGVTVEVVLCDVGVSGDVERLAERLRELGPVRGVIHGAGALQDRTLASLGREDVEVAFRAKVRGTTLVERATRSARRDFFVAYSSIAGLLGARGQANHAAANAWLDTFVAGLRVDGATAASIAWGPWSESGAAARDDVLARARREGLEPMSDVEGVAGLAEVFEAPPTFVVATHLARPEVAAERGHERLLSAWRAPAPSAGVTAGAAAPARVVERPRPTAPAQGVLERIAAAPARVRRDHLGRHLGDRIRTVLGLPEGAEIEDRRPLGELGLDSLLAVELRNVLGRDFDRQLSSTLLFDHPTLDDLTDHLMALLDLDTPPVSAPPADPPAEAGVEAPVPPGGVGEVVGRLESMSDDEVARRLAERLGR